MTCLLSLSLSLRRVSQGLLHKQREAQHDCNETNFTVACIWIVLGMMLLLLDLKQNNNVLPVEAPVSGEFSLNMV